MDFFTKRLRKEIAPLPEGINEVTQLISKKWIIDILYILRSSDLSFTNLRNELKSISNQELAKKLKLLEEYGLVEKQPSFMGDDDKMIYVSTVAGKDLCDLIMEIKAFGEKYLLKKKEKTIEETPES